MYFCALPLYIAYVNCYVAVLCIKPLLYVMEQDILEVCLGVGVGAYTASNQLSIKQVKRPTFTRLNSSVGILATSNNNELAKSHFSDVKDSGD